MDLSTVASNPNTNEPLRNELMNLLKGRRGHFKLESGHHGDLWFELDFLFLHPARLSPFVKELAKLLSKYKIEAICGPLLGGAFIGELIASELDIEFYYSERVANQKKSDELYSVEYKIPDTLRYNVRGKKIAIVDDVISAGSASRKTYFDLQACGAKPLVIAALLIKGSSIVDFATDKNVGLESTASVHDNLWLPTNCPLCASQIAIENVGA